MTETLIVYYSLTGRTAKICRSLQQSSGAECAELRQARGYSRIGAYLFGALRAKKGKGVDLLPMPMDTSMFDRIIVAGPVWRGAPAPAVVGFLHSYDLNGKEVHGLLTYSGSAGDASQIFRRETAAAGAVCASVVTFNSSPGAMDELESGKAQLYLAQGDGIALRRRDSV